MSVSVKKKRKVRFLELVEFVAVTEYRRLTRAACPTLDFNRYTQSGHSGRGKPFGSPSVQWDNALFRTGERLVERLRRRRSLFRGATPGSRKQKEEGCMLVDILKQLALPASFIIEGITGIDHAS